ncbi:hypothetical protein TYRP_019623 [Tyrophagus putrescentiae]|nr:hypothetical protein TYRP_019623 [Tyrophagus putrescentiae]
MVAHTTGHDDGLCGGGSLGTALNDAGSVSQQFRAIARKARLDPSPSPNRPAIIRGSPANPRSAV